RARDCRCMQSTSSFDHGDSLMSRTMFALLSALCALAILPLAAHAQRPLSFETHAVPAEGTVAIAVQEGLPEGGTFAAIDAASGGALRRVADAEGFKGRADSTLDLRGFAGYDRLLVV